MVHKFIVWISGSFEETTTGASAKKMCVFAIMSCVVMAHVSFIKYCFIHENFTLLPEVLTIDFFFIAVCLGLAVYSQKIKMDNELKTDAADQK